MTDKKEEPIKVVFAPGAFDTFEGTQEELEELQKEILEMFAGKSRDEIKAIAVPMDELMEDDLPEEVIRQLNAYQEGVDNERTKKLH
jgi:hypothetical protein